MSRGTTTHQEYDAAASSRRAGVIVVAAAAVVAVMLQTHGTCPGGNPWSPGFSGGFGLFEWPHWALVVALVVTGLMLTQAQHTPIAAAVAFVVAAELAGAGIVAQHHWRGAAGPGCGVWANQHLIKTIAVAAASASIVAALACFRIVWSARSSEPRLSGAIVRLATLFIAAVVAVALPPLLAVGDPFAHDQTSIGAFALLWSLPWGGALALTAWLTRPAAIAAALTVAVSAASTYPHYELVSVKHQLDRRTPRPRAGPGRCRPEVALIGAVGAGLQASIGEAAPL